MARDSAAVAALDDRRRRRCPISAASDAPPDDASSLMTNGMITCGSSSNGDVGVGDGGSSPKSSSAASTSTGGGSSSGSSRSGSDDDDSGTAVVRPSSAIDRGCQAAANASPTPPSLHKDDVVVDNSGDKESSSCSNSDDAATNDTSTSIGGRLTFYKDGQFIFQLAAHHQKQSYNNQSATTTPCRWIPVPTVLQQHKNNIKSIGDWSHHQQNKTIWPYLVTSPASESKSPQPVQQSQPSVVKIGERKQQYQPRTTPPPLTPISGTVNVASCTTAVVMATTTNIVRRPSRKCSITSAAENTTDGQNQNWQLQSQSRPLSKRLQPYQHQSFMMVVTKEIKAQRRLLSLPNKQRRRCRKTSTAVVRESLSLEKQPPHINLECVVRNLWCRRHTTELLMRRQLSMNNSVDSVAAITAVDTAPAPRHVVATTTGSVDSTCSPITTGNGKRRSMFFPLPATDLTIPTSASAMITNSMGITGSSSPSKKYRLGQQQQRSSAVDKSVKKPILPCPSLAPVQASNNDHSITAILSGGAAGTKRAANSGGVVTAVVDSENCTITSATSSTTTSAAVTSQKMSPLPCPAPLSLLRTLLKSPGGEIGPSPVVASSINGAGGGGGYKHHQSGRKRSAAVESTAVAPPIPPPAAATTVDGDPCRLPTVMASPSASGAGAVNDAAAAAAALTALHQLPVLHHPSTVAAAGQLAAAGYFNVLYHQAAMAAAMAYQTHAQLPKSQPLLSSQFPAPAGNSWQRQLNCRRPPVVVPTTEAIAGSGVAAMVASSASTVVAPYSSPLVAVGVNGGGGLLPPATPSPPPPPLPLHPQPVHHHRHHHLLLHQQPQYQPVPTIQKPQSSFHQHTKRRPLQGSSGVKQRTAMTATGSVAEYGDRVDGKSVGAVDVESSASADCVPLNLSKDSVTENVGDTSTTAKVR